MSEKVKQQLHFVAFIDLLGYKDFFKDKKHDVAKFLETINEALTATIVETNQHYDGIPSEYKPKIKMFSDNILIAVKCVNRNSLDFWYYLNLVRTVAHIQKKFINTYQLFLRGGIAKGMFYIGDEYVFGEALIKAYEMEQYAVYPKIKVDGDYIERIAEYVRKKEARYEQMANTLKDVVGRERDGSYFVNYLPTHPWGHDIDENFGIESIFSEDVVAVQTPTSKKSREVVALHKSALLEKISEYGSYTELFSQKDIDNRKKVILKYMWSVDYHNQACKALGFDDLLIHCAIEIDPRTLQPVVKLLGR